jgi:hypothetical protein
VDPSCRCDVRGLRREDFLDLDDHPNFDVQDHYDYLVSVSEMGIVPELVDTVVIRPSISR